MMVKALGLLALVLGPAVAMYLAGFAAQAHYFALGTVLAAQMSLLARPVAGFSVLLPLAYAAAAITAQSTGGVAALIVAVAAIVGAASSQGLQRGLLAVLAATLIGSSEPAAPSAVLAPTLAMFVGSTYGFVLAGTALRNVIVDARAVDPDTALSFAVLLAVLVIVAWLAARVVGLEHGWWVAVRRGRRGASRDHWYRRPLACGPRRHAGRHAGAGGDHRNERLLLRSGRSCCWPSAP